MCTHVFQPVYVTEQFCSTVFTSTKQWQSAFYMLCPLVPLEIPVQNKVCLSYSQCSRLLLLEA